MKTPGYCIVIVSIALCAAFSACAKVPHYELSRFVDPDTCGSCHEAIYKQWKGSMHNLSHVDPIYREVALHDLKAVTAADELKEAEHAWPATPRSASFRGCRQKPPTI